MSDVPVPDQPSDVAAKIEQLSPEGQDQVTRLVASIAATEAAAPDLLSSAEVAVKYDALDDRGKARIGEVLTRVQARVASEAGRP